ncbi:MAG TPA: hypothetical protein VGR00_08100 [Thermoanaerobaculia bacterium]|nr:hypothetical protein [Thermoanaerobaculia bacterium]
MSVSILEEILAAKRRRLAAGEFTPRGTPALASDGAAFEKALRGAGPHDVRVVAEIKHRSPSAGVILSRPERDLVRVAAAYRRGGAAAISVVVEQDFFGGDPEWIQRVKAASGLPVLMKDFVLDEVQLDFALSIGADAVLLLASALEDESLARLHRAARERGLAALVESHDEAEVRRVAALGVAIAGVNARDLSTFRVDLLAMGVLGSLLPAGAIRVAESGIGGRADVEALLAAGFGAFLVGESLLKSPDPARKLRELRGVPATGVKICGLTREEDVACAVAAGADALGFIFSPRSPRRLDVDRAERLASGAKGTNVVPVFSGNELAEVRAVVERLRPAAVQWNDAPNAEVAALGVPLWQVVRMGADDPGTAMAWPSDAFLFDTSVRGEAGGTGKTFDWGALKGLRRDRRWILAGGLRPENVLEAIEEVAPDDVDVASGVEAAPGIKDASRVRAFVESVRRGRKERV